MCEDGRPAVALLNAYPKYPKQRELFGSGRGVWGNRGEAGSVGWGGRGRPMTVCWGKRRLELGALIHSSEAASLIPRVKDDRIRIHSCQMAIARFLDRMCLALWASGLLPLR